MRVSLLPSLAVSHSPTTNNMRNRQPPAAWHGKERTSRKDAKSAKTFFALLASLREVPGKPGASRRFHEHRPALAPAHAQRRQAVAQAAPLQVLQQRQDQPRPRRP